MFVSVDFDKEWNERYMELWKERGPYPSLKDISKEAADEFHNKHQEFIRKVKEMTDELRIKYNKPIL